MVPIGIVTQDRPAYLDITLRSLSATQLPADVPLTVFDDCSVAEQTLAYYGTATPLQVEHTWPYSENWIRHGLDVINNNSPPVTGIHGRVDVRRLAEKPLGVVNASCRAIHHLFTRFPSAPGIILLQDDVVFNADWYDRMLGTVAKTSQFSFLPLGLLAGIKLNHKYEFKGRPPIAVDSGITAQCLYISRLAYERRNAYFTKEHTIKKRFDDTLRRELLDSQFWVGCIYPFVCQHFGVRSIVRPGKSWTFMKSGRIGYYAYPPFVLANKVREFKGCFQ